MASALRSREYESASSVTTFHQCGEQYRRKYVAGERDADNLPAVAGNVLHDVFEQDTFERDSKDSLLADAKRLLREVEGLERLPFWGRQDAKWWFTTGLEVRVDNYLKCVDRWDEQGFRPLGVEVEGRVTLAAGVVPLRFFIDRLHYDGDGDLVGIDWKTGKPKPYHAIQLELYRVAYNAAALADGRPLIQYTQAVYLGDAKKGPQFAMYPPQLTLPAAAEMVRRVNEATTFPFNGIHTDACGLCAFRPDCLPGQVGERSL